MILPVFVVNANTNKNLWKGEAPTGFIETPNSNVTAFLASLATTYRTSGAARFYVVDKASQDAAPSGVSAAQALYDYTHNGTTGTSTTKSGANTTFAANGPNELTQNFRMYVYLSDATDFATFVTSLNNNTAKVMQGGSRIYGADATNDVTKVTISKGF